jgi:hypothetical protein
MLAHPLTHKTKTLSPHTRAVDSVCVCEVSPQKKLLRQLHCKKGYWFSRRQPGCHLPNSPWPGIIRLFPARGSLVSSILSGNGKTANLFLQCICVKAETRFSNTFCERLPKLSVGLGFESWSGAVSWARIAKRFRSPGIDSKESIPPG